ncbi:SGNH/GDSL hydrolase family protein [Nocardia sp. NBC_01503]|uniref:SGNH/GDSL hydrolase family protein n=1 Tax=Nocardia sp. NBC_01503 TaxID=2975997 RepID=UPI002E7BD5F9|nr:SGNH/GDSL hydrolase family protein [Nocardia sp. NBC_01503]WTL30220.1 SGNH/GDSL hydrolase family protein [Nocardia sp. NBC_01503]
MPLRSARNTALTLGVVAVCCTSTPAAADSVSYREYVALGDSWTAAVFTTLPPATTDVPADCVQSSSNYPHQVAKALGIKNFRDASCASATTVDMTGAQELPLGGVNPPQFDKLTATTDLVTVGIGGNDIGFPTLAMHCLQLVPAAASESEIPACATTSAADGTDPVTTRINAAAPLIQATIAGIRQRAPKARVLLVDYLNALPVTGKGCRPDLPAADIDITYLRDKFAQMNAMLAKVAAASHTELVNTYTPSTGHDVCQPAATRYVEGIAFSSPHNFPGAAYPLHPNALGANAQTAAVLDQIKRGG